MVTGSRDQEARVWDAASGQELLLLKGHSDRIGSVAVSPDGQRIVTGSDDLTAKVWETESGKDLFTLKGHDARISSVAFSPDGRTILTGSGDQTAKVWEAATGKDLFTLKGHDAGLWSLAFSPDGKRIVTGCEDEIAKVWDAAIGKELLTLKGHNNGISSVAFFPDGRWIVTGCVDGTAKVWEATTGKQLFSLKGHDMVLWCIVFSPDGKRIVTGCEDGTAKLWEAESGKELLTLKGQSYAMRLVTFSSDGRRISTCSGFQTAEVWETAEAQQVVAWQLEERGAEERLALLQQERAAAAEHDRALHAQDPGVITQWLVLVPIAFQGRSGGAALQGEQIPHEANLKPQAGERVNMGQGERVWRAVQLPDYRIDFNYLSGQPTSWSVAYAVCYIQSETEQSGLLMKVGSDDEAKVYLNGTEIYRRGELRSFVPDQDVVAGVRLKAGLNVLVFKVVNETSAWAGSIRFTDAAGQPVKGIRVTLVP
jgi:hypothetical protein